MLLSLRKQTGTKRGEDDCGVAPRAGRDGFNPNITSGGETQERSKIFEISNLTREKI